MSPAIQSTLVLGVTLALFASGKVRHDLVALMALAASLLLGLVAPGEAFAGFADQSVIVIVAVLIIGRAVEITGVADVVTDRLAALKAPFPIQLGILLVAAAALSAFMNNIAALAITMPAVIGICRAHNLPAGAGLMPLAFATILGGMTTLIGTPANLILSSVRAEALGEPFGFFQMTPIAAAVAAAGVAYICLIGWLLAPRRDDGKGKSTEYHATFELGPLSHDELDEAAETELLEALKSARVVPLAVLRGSRALDLAVARPLQPRDRLLVSGSVDPWEAARKSGLPLHAQPSQAKDAATIVTVVGYGSPLIGRPLDTIRWDNNGDLVVLAGGRRAASLRQPLSRLRVEAGDQITVHGSAEQVAIYSRYARLLEVARRAMARIDLSRALTVLAIYAAAVAVSVVSPDVPTAFSFAAAAAAIAALGFLPSREIYSSVDWSIIVLIGAMIPVGESFQSSGAALLFANGLAHMLGDAPVFWAAATLVTATMLVSIFLNNVATAIIMGQIAIPIASQIGVSPDALLIAVLIGASSDFLTPIGHQNNLLVMGAGGYRFGDYARVGAPLALLVIFVSAKMIELVYAGAG